VALLWQIWGGPELAAGRFGLAGLASGSVPLLWVLAIAGLSRLRTDVKSGRPG